MQDQNITCRNADLLVLASHQQHAAHQVCSAHALSPPAFSVKEKVRLDNVVGVYAICCHGDVICKPQDKVSHVNVLVQQVYKVTSFVKTYN
ncbi:hypothetical protein E2C01_007257 [Portunus trituberculatus]|uniref:Uncharacterized protein n=1 Tax=Portunus trituberculatus TaxID=210409 RepID=A0A5B7CYH6_PORTR|nr:hypothetical protein [Portunus trituberculatus]